MESDGRIVQSRWKNANNQKWKVIRDLQGNYYIQNVESSKGISFANGSIQGTVYNQSASQQLQLEKRDEILLEDQRSSSGRRNVSNSIIFDRKKVWE